MVELDALTVTREAYDGAASTYVQLFRDALRDSPLDRAILGAFAEVVSAPSGLLFGKRWSISPDASLRSHSRAGLSVVA